MHERMRGRASEHRARVRRRQRAHVRWCLAINPSANKTTQKARARPRSWSRWAASPLQTRDPMCSSTHTQCGPRARPCRAASALTVPTCIEAYCRDDKDCAAARPSTKTMVLCTGTQGSCVRSPPCQGRLGRAASSAASAPHAFSSRFSPDSCYSCCSSRFSEVVCLLLQYLLQSCS